MHKQMCDRGGGHPAWAVDEHWKPPDKPQLLVYQAEGQITRDIDVMARTSPLPHLSEKASTQERRFKTVPTKLGEQG